MFVSCLLDRNPMAKRCKEELLTMFEEHIAEKKGSSLVLGTVVKTFSPCVADGAQFVFCIFKNDYYFLVKLPHNFLSCNSNECLPPAPQLLRKGRIYCCWTCIQTDHKSGRCFLFLAHWEFYWLLSFFSSHYFFTSLEVRARCYEGENTNTGNSNIFLSSSVGVVKDRVLERLVKLMVLERGCAVERH